MDLQKSISANKPRGNYSFEDTKHFLLLYPPGGNFNGSMTGLCHLASEIPH